MIPLQKTLRLFRHLCNPITCILHLSLCLILFPSTAFTQTTVKKTPVADLKPIAADCRNAIKIPLVRKGTYGPTMAPKGPGEVKEIKCADKKSVYFFSQEHNSAWYYFDIVQDGELIFEIIPEKKGDDYDFLLFRWPDTTCCDDQDEIPVRTNISRSGRSGTARTGLAAGAVNECVKSGAGETFSKPILVRKKERYYLVLDNVYPNGGGHTIRFQYLKTFELSGTITDDQDRPLNAEILVEDMKGIPVYRGNAESGQFRILTPLLDEGSYTVTFSHDSTFFACRYFPFDTLVKFDYKARNMKIRLPRVEVGKKYLLEEVRFLKHSVDLQPQADNSLKALIRFLQKNPKLILRVEGHANDPFGNIGEENCMKLSEVRAASIRDYLVSSGINKLRVSMKAHGREEMLFPNAINQMEYDANRRIEITILSLK